MAQTVATLEIDIAAPIHVLPIFTSEFSEIQQLLALLMHPKIQSTPSSLKAQKSTPF